MQTTRLAAAMASTVDCGNLAPLGVHHVRVGVVDAHRLEGAGADMQRDPGRGDAGLGQGGHEGRREVKPGGGGGDGAVMFGEQGLIVGTVPCVGGAAANVGRQRYRAALLQGCEKRVTSPVERQHH